MQTEEEKAARQSIKSSKRIKQKWKHTYVEYLPRDGKRKRSSKGKDMIKRQTPLCSYLHVMYIEDQIQSHILVHSHPKFIKHPKCVQYLITRI